MIEKLCPVHNVPVYGEKCSMPGCDARPIVSTTIYWCKECNVPSLEAECHYCHSKCEYIATDMRPVFPEEKQLLAILWGYENPLELDEHSVWNSNSGYYIDGVKKELVIKEINALPLSQIKGIKAKYDEYLPKVDRTYFVEMIQKFTEVNQERYFDITDEAISYIQSFQDSCSLDDMFVSFTQLGFPEKLGIQIAKQLGSPKAMNRMLGYLYNVKPRSAELVVDEMLAICSDIDA